MVPNAVVENPRVAAEKTAPELIPVPCRLTSCDPPGALSASASDPVRLPADVGTKVTTIVQLAFAPRAFPQLFVCEKSPETEIELMLKLAFP